MVSNYSANVESSPYVMTDAELQQLVIPVNGSEKIKHIMQAVFNENIDILKRFLRIAGHFHGKALHVLARWIHYQAVRLILLQQMEERARTEPVNIWNTLWNDPNLSWNRFRHPLDRKPEWKKDSEGLIVLLSGLWDSTLNWNRHIRLISSYNEPIDLYVPLIPRSGNCSLDAAYPGILEAVRDYTLRYSQKPIAFIAMSNGGRIASTIAGRFPDVPVMLSCIASPLFGSPVAKAVHRLSLHKYVPFVDGEMCRELSYGSEKAHAVLEEIVHTKATAERAFRFYASEQDLLVPLKSALPKIGKENCEFRIVRGVGHAAITELVAERQVKECMEWLINHRLRSEKNLRSKL